MPNSKVDVVVVGSGAGGGIVAKELAEAGLSVVVFERGKKYSLADFNHDELNSQYSVPPAYGTNVHPAASPPSRSGTCHPAFATIQHR